MNPAEEEVNSASPLNAADTTDGATANTPQPERTSQPAANPPRTVDPRTPGPTNNPAATNRPPAATNRPPAATNRPPAATNRPPAATNRPPAATNRPPAATNRPPAPRPGGPPRSGGPPRNPGPARGPQRPGTRPPIIHYRPAKVSTLRRYCVPVTTAVLVVASLVVIAILIKVVIDNYYFFCTKSFKFIPLDKWCDGHVDCNGGEDELHCVQKVDFSNSSIVRFSDVGSILQILTGAGTWSYVCSDGFDDAKAKAVCAEVGFSSKPSFSSISSATVNGQFGNIQLSNQAFQIIPTRTCASGSIISLNCIECGINHQKLRIIGGHDTTIEDAPWQVSMQYMGQHSCGGSIINSLFILCAAHCFPKLQQQVERWRVEVGHTKLKFVFGHRVDKIFIPTSYSLDLKPNDIAIIKLKNELSFSAAVQPICLPGFDSILQPGAALKVTGWGHTVEGGNSLSSVLQEVSISLISRDVCNNEYFGQILSTMLCAGRLSGGLDTCQGDSGGPLVSLGPNDCWQQVGIVSWGEGCGRPGRVGIYTNVPPFLPWITSAMKAAM